MPEWRPYACAIPGGSKYAPGDGNALSEVYHITHVPTARRILEDSRLRAGLVYDESRLRRSRLCVTWLSANIWANGSYYGNVQFSFNWKDIIANRHVYWVEAMTGYKNHAYRLLLTERDLTDSKHVRPYDPETDHGPLRRRGKDWFWNDKYTSEFMLEADVPLSDCTAVSFIRHHATICRPDGSSCPDRSANSEQIGGRFLAFMLGNGIDDVNHALMEKGKDGNQRLSSAAQSAVTGIWRALASKKERFAGGLHRSASRRAVLRGAMALYGSDQVREARDLVSLLKSWDVFEKALVEVIEDHFSLSGYKLPD